MSEHDQIKVFAQGSDTFSFDEAWSDETEAPSTLSDEDLAAQGVRRWFDPAAKALRIPAEHSDTEEHLHIPGVTAASPRDVLPTATRHEGAILPHETWQVHDDRVDDTWLAYAVDTDRHMRLDDCRSCPLWDASSCRADPMEPTEGTGADRASVALPEHCPHAVDSDFDTREAAIRAMVSQYLVAWGGRASRGRLVAAVHHRAAALGTTISFAEIQAVFTDAMADAGARWSFSNVLDCGTNDATDRRAAAIEADEIAVALASSQAHETGLTETRLTDFLFSEVERAGMSEPPSTARERTLLARAQAGDRAARDEMWLRNIRLAHWAARRFGALGATDFMDRWSAGMIALVRPIEKFDLERESKFSTYASLWLNQAIRRQHDNEDRLVRIPSHVSQPLYAHVVRARLGIETFEELVSAVEFPR